MPDADASIEAVCHRPFSTLQGILRFVITASDYQDALEEQLPSRNRSSTNQAPEGCSHEPTGSASGSRPSNSVSWAVLELLESLVDPAALQRMLRHLGGAAAAVTADIVTQATMVLVEGSFRNVVEDAAARHMDGSSGACHHPGLQTACCLERVQPCFSSGIPACTIPSHGLIWLMIPASDRVESDGFSDGGLSRKSAQHLKGIKA